MSQDPYARRPDDWAAPETPHPSQTGGLVDPYSTPQVGWSPPAQAQQQYAQNQYAPQAYVQYQSPPPTVAMRLRPQRPVVTIGIIALCLAVWLGELGSQTFLGEIALGPDLGLLEPWRLLTSAFAHSPQVMHIAFNMLALWSLGQGLELALGRARFAAMYLLSALGGSVAFLLWSFLTGDRYVYVVGASGAVFGLFGALLPIQKRVGISSNSLWVTIGINAVIGFTIPGIAWQAHLGGFLTGLACGALMMRSVDEARRTGQDRTWGYLGGVMAVLVALFAACYTLV